MAISNYGTLKAAIANYLNRSDLTSNIPDFIQMAEWRIARDTRITPLINVYTATFTASQKTVALPTGFMEMLDVQVQSTNAELNYVPPDQIDRVYAKGPSTGDPWVYTIRGNNIDVAPAASATIGVTLKYYKREDALNDTSATSWFTTNAPDVLLYGSLLEASPYIMEDQRIQIWQQFYERAIQNLNSQYGVVDPYLRMLKRSRGTDLGGGTSKEVS